MNIIDEDGYQLAKIPKRLGHDMPEIFSVDTDLAKRVLLEYRWSRVLFEFRRNQDRWSKNFGGR
jgi:hypothetical protein